MAVGAPGRPSTGTVMTSLGVLLLAVAIVILVYAMIVTPAEPRHTV